MEASEAAEVRTEATLGQGMKVADQVMAVGGAVLMAALWVMAAGGDLVALPVAT